MIFVLVLRRRRLRDDDPVGRLDDAAVAAEVPQCAADVEPVVIEPLGLHDLQVGQLGDHGDEEQDDEPGEGADGAVHRVALPPTAAAPTAAPSRVEDATDAEVLSWEMRTRSASST